MTQDELWVNKHEEVVVFIEANKRNPSKHCDEERGRYLNWLNHNRKLFAAVLIKEDRVEKIRVLMEVSERYKHKNQYE